MTSKLPKVQTSIFATMSLMAQEYGAINLSQGFPDFPIDERLYDLVHAYSKKGFNQYAPMPGILSLRQEIAQKIEQEHQVVFDPNTEITITSGATQALFTAISAFIHAGDEVLIFTPAYDSYAPVVELNLGKVIEIPLDENTFDIPWDLVYQKLSHKTKMIVFNNPHNPCGKLFTQADLDQLAAICEKYPNILLLSDEVYEYLVFDDQKFIPAFTHPGLKDKTLSVYSFGKTFHVTGWKMGYIVGPEVFMKEFRKVHQFNVFGSPHPVQCALAEYMNKYANYPAIGLMYQQKRDFFLQGLKNTKFTFTPSQSTYFQLLEFSSYSNKSDLDYAKQLTQESKLASIPLSPFYHQYTPSKKYLRFCFAKQEETLQRAIDILQSL